ncbi:hypothetical protein ACF06X_03040 [Streptomyces sp. NPDC015346]|uniref:hypothetical protein n=1 Tax=Streptomyces sp. NPDC015346 TaxID=3364954 RepID=UPI0036FA43F6
MTLQESETNDSPETVDLGEARFVRDPFDAYRQLRERGTMARGVVPGVDPTWVATGYDDVRMVMSDARFVIDAATVPRTPVAHRTEQTWQARGMFSGYEKYLRAGLFDSDGRDHRRLGGWCPGRSPRAGSPSCGQESKRSPRNCSTACPAASRTAPSIWPSISRAPCRPP